MKKRIHASTREPKKERRKKDKNKKSSHTKFNNRDLEVAPPKPPLLQPACRLLCSPDELVVALDSCSARHGGQGSLSLSFFRDPRHVPLPVVWEGKNGMCSGTDGFVSDFADQYRNKSRPIALHDWYRVSLVLQWDRNEPLLLLHAVAQRHDVDDDDDNRKKKKARVASFGFFSHFFLMF